MIMSSRGGDKIKSRKAKEKTKMKKYNIPNAHFESIKETLRKGTEADQQLYDDVNQIIVGNFTHCTKWEQVENILDCFDDNDDFDIREVDGVFFVQGVTGTAKKRMFEADIRGDLAESEKEKNTVNGRGKNK